MTSPFKESASLAGPVQYHGQPHASVAGFAYGPKSSRRVPARLIRDGQGIHIVEDDTDEVLYSGQPSSRERMPGGPFLIQFGAAQTQDALWTFETAEASAAADVLGEADDRWLSALEVWHPRLIAIVALCMLGAYSIWRWGLDLLAVAAVAMTPSHFVEAIDAGNLAAMDRFISEPTELSQTDQNKVRGIFDAVAEAAPSAPYGAYTLEFRSVEPIGPNAFALPGGTIVVTDALVRRFPDENVIAGILGHELAHISERHSLKQLYRSLSTYAVVAMMAGDVGPILEDVLLEGSAVASLAFSREHEADADAIGVRSAAKAGYEPAALAHFFEELQSEGEGLAPQWLSTHPSHEDRIDTIRALAEDQ